MRRTADVLEIIDDNTAKVMLYKHKKCHGCGSCNKHVHPGSVLEAENKAKAQKGEMVNVRIKKKFSFLEFLVGYILPAISFLLGIYVGSMFFPGQSGAGVAVFIGFLCLAASLACNLLYKKKYQPIYSASIIKRVMAAEPK